LQELLFETGYPRADVLGGSIVKNLASAVASESAAKHASCVVFHRTLRQECRQLEFDLSGR
jgi:hypothetical protein